MIAARDLAAIGDQDGAEGGHAVASPAPTLRCGTQRRGSLRFSRRRRRDAFHHSRSIFSPRRLALLDEGADALAASPASARRTVRAARAWAQRLAHRGAHQLLGLGDRPRRAAQALVDGRRAHGHQLAVVVGHLVHQADAQGVLARRGAARRSPGAAPARSRCAATTNGAICAGMRPTVTSGVPICALFSAIAQSATATRPTPPPMAAPSISDDHRLRQRVGHLQQRAEAAVGGGGRLCRRRRARPPSSPCP